MTSLFFRLQKLNKEATPGPWEANAFEEDGEFFVQVRAGEQASWVEKPLRASIVFNGENCYADAQEQANVELAAECRNSLPAVLNAIELLRRLSEWDALAPPVQAPFGDGPFWKREIDAALEPFIEEQP